jgi:hypothetical protein
MHRVLLYAIGLPLATLLGALGCQSDANLRPPKQPEAFNLPPENDPKFSQPTEYPRQLLFQDSIHNADQGPTGVPGAGGMRGPGVGGGSGMR